MVFRLFKKRRDVEEKLSGLHDSLNDSFSKIKDDMGSVGEWIKHFDQTKETHHSKMENLDTRLRSVEEFVMNLMEQSPVKEVSKQLSKQEQTAVRPNQTDSVSKQVFEQPSKQQEVVQTDIEKALISLTAMERALVWSLLNTDILLSYEDMGRILGKDQSTVRGQINNIKRKIPGLIEEKSEDTGKKRYYVNEGKKRDILVKYTGKRAKKVESES
jgi:DNA-binding CsgD family transcriptional regulator